MTATYDEIARVMLEGRSFATDVGLDHLRRYGQPMISMAKAQTMRSAVIGQLLSDDTPLSVVDRYLASGRVEFVREDGLTLLLKSVAALPLEAPFASTEPFVPDDSVFLLTYEFVADRLLLGTVPAQPFKQDGRTRYRLLDNITPRGEWDLIVGTIPTFDQGENEASEDDWYNEVFVDEETETEVG